MHSNTEALDKLLRLPEVLQIVPVSRSTWYAGQKTGKFPQGIKLGSRVTCYRESEIRKIVEGGSRN